MRHSHARRLVALLAMIAFSLSVTETVAALCATVDEELGAGECTEMEMEMEMEHGAAAHAAHASAGDDRPAHSGHPSMPGGDCPLMAAGACVGAVSLPGSGSAGSHHALSSADVSARNSAAPLSAHLSGLLRPPIS